MQVRLSPEEIQQGAMAGVARRVSKYREDTKDRAQNEESSWDNEIGGALAEMAWSKLRGVYWTGMEGKEAPDDCGGVQLRWTRHSTGGLIIYRQDNDEDIFILSTGCPVFEFVGWMRGKEAKREAHWEGKLMIVCQSLLNKMADLPS